MGEDTGQNQERAPSRCLGVTRGGAPCRRRAGRDGYCPHHAAPAFYARALSPEERARYLEALAQEGLSGEVAVLRLHLLRLLERIDGEGQAEIPRTVHALVRALRSNRGTEAETIAALDAAVRAEGQRLLDVAEQEARADAMQGTRANAMPGTRAGAGVTAGGTARVADWGGPFTQREDAPGSGSCYACTNGLNGDKAP